LMQHVPSRSLSATSHVEFYGEYVADLPAIAVC
jgi:hypothetical protein